MNEMIYRKMIALLFVFFVFVLDGLSQTLHPINIVTTPVPFLRISPDARAGGMGDVGIAASPDANSIFWNMAKTNFASHNTSFGINYNPWLRDISRNIYMGVIDGYTKLNDGQTVVGGSVRYFSLGDVQFTDFDGNYLQTYKPKEFSIDLGLSKKLSERMAIGVTLRYINSSIVNGSSAQDTYKTGNSVAGDISLFYHGLKKDSSGFCWGITASNLGAKIGYTNQPDAKEFIPANLGVGVAYTKVIDPDSKLTFAADGNKLLVPELVYTGVANQDFINMSKYRQYSVFESWFAKNHNFSIAAGAEYSFKNMFFARGGYYYEDKSQGDRKYVTAGVGLRYSDIAINFSYLLPSGAGTTKNPLSNSMRLGLIFTHDKK